MEAKNMRKLVSILIIIGVLMSSSISFAESLGEIYATQIKSVIYEATGGSVVMPDTSYNLLVSNGDAFFADGRTTSSLDYIARTVFDGDISKNVLKYSNTIVQKSEIHIDNINEAPFINGKMLTVAIGHTGGDLSIASGNYIEPTYYKVFYVGSTNIRKTGNTILNGIPIGETTVQITDANGTVHTKPMYIMVAGNFSNMLDRYAEQKKQAALNNPYRDEVSLIMKELSRTEYKIGNAGKQPIYVDRITFNKYIAYPNVTIQPEEAMTIDSTTFNISELDFLSTEIDPTSRFMIVANVGTFIGKSNGKMDQQKRSGLTDIVNPRGDKIINSTYNNGDTYVGEIKEGKRHGYGTYTWSNGDKYMGDFYEGKRTGYGLYVWPNGTWYEGEWKDGVRHGIGKTKMSDGRIFNSSWENGKKIS
jgi:hypothetical protein